MESSQRLLNDIARMAGDFKVPNVYLEAVLHGRRKDIEALLESGRGVKDGEHTRAHEYANALRASLEDLRRAMSESADIDGARLQAVRKAARKSLASMGELAQLALRSQSQGFDALRQRTQDDIEALGKLVAGPS